MRRIAVILAFCLCLSAPALAEEAAPPAAPPESPQVEVIEDQEAGSVRVLIGGKEVLTIDAQGLHVNGNIQYTGWTADTGSIPEPQER